MKTRISILLLFAAVTLSAQPSCTHTLRWAPQGAIQVWQQGLLTLSYTQGAPNGRTVTPNGWNGQDQIVIFYIREIDNPGQIPPAHYSAPIQETQICTGTLNPPPATIQIVRGQCIGSGGNCAGIELWAVTVGGITRQYTATPATPDEINIPACPQTTAMPCWQPAALGDAPLSSGGAQSIAQVFCRDQNTANYRWPNDGVGLNTGLISDAQLFAFTDAQVPPGCRMHRNEPATQDDGSPAGTITYLDCPASTYSLLPLCP